MVNVSCRPRAFKSESVRNANTSMKLSCTVKANYFGNRTVDQTYHTLEMPHRFPGTQRQLPRSTFQNNFQGRDLASSCDIMWVLQSIAIRSGRGFTFSCSSSVWWQVLTPASSRKAWVRKWRIATARCVERPVIGWLPATIGLYNVLPKGREYLFPRVPLEGYSLPHLFVVKPSSEVQTPVASGTLHPNTSYSLSVHTVQYSISREWALDYEPFVNNVNIDTVLRGQEICDDNVDTCPVESRNTWMK